MPKVRKPNRKDPQKKFKCEICSKWKRGTRFYKSHSHYKCDVCLRKLRKTQGGNIRCDITVNPTKGTFMYMFKYVISRLVNRKGLDWRTTEKWFSCHIISRFDKYIRDQLKELNMGDYKKTWKLGFIQTDGLTLRDQFKYRNLLVVSIKQ